MVWINLGVLWVVSRFWFRDISFQKFQKSKKKGINFLCLILLNTQTFAQYFISIYKTFLLLFTLENSLFVSMIVCVCVFAHNVSWIYNFSIIHKQQTARTDQVYYVLPPTFYFSFSREMCVKIVPGFYSKIFHYNKWFTFHSH